MAFGTTRKSGAYNLKTTEGLLEFASQNPELIKKINKVSNKPKEDPDEIFSGGLMSDVFDGLNALQYGVVGLVKGKSFTEGVKTRESFSKKDSLGQYGIPGVIAGTIADIAFDPLTYVGGFGIGKRIFSGLEKVAPVAVKALRKLPLGDKAVDFLGHKFVYRFGQDPVYAQMAERNIKDIAIGQANLIDIARPLTKLDSEAQKVIAIARKSGNLDKLPKKFWDTAQPAFDELDKLGKEAVDLGLLDADTYVKNVGKYMPRLYKKYEIPEKVGQLFPNKKAIRANLDRFKKREDIPQEIREAMGEIVEAGYPTAKGLLQLKQSIERTKFFNEVASKFSVNEGIKGFTKLSDTKKLGSLSGKYVPNFIAEDLNYMLEPAKSGLTQKLVAGFKFGKVILNPATHSRNIMDNFILNSWEGLSPARLDIYAEAAKDLATKGNWYQEAKAVGLGLDTFASRELKDILVGPESKGLLGVVKRAGNKIANMYQKEEEFAKLAQYIFQRKSGLGIDEAWKVAERATFNYAQVTPFIKKMRENVFGMPFITFTYKVTPQFIKTAIKYPTRISNIGKIKNAIENLSPREDLKRERANEPDYIKNGFFVRLPKKDKYGRSSYFDLSYIVPFGDVIGGNMFEIGQGQTPVQSAFAKFPLLNAIKELSQNKDFFGNKIIKDSSVETSEIGKDIFQYLMKSYAPSLMEGGIETLFNDDVAEEVGLKGLLPGRLGQSIAMEKEGSKKILEEMRTTRTTKQEILRGLLGLKVTPYNVEKEITKREAELRKKLQQIFIDEGLMKEFTIPFIPK